MKQYRYLILGGGIVAGYAARTFVEAGLKPGDLAIVSADADFPYERPPLSKGFLAGGQAESDIRINDPAFYEDHGIAVYLRAAATSLDATSRRLQTASGDAIAFEKLLVATGSRPRTLDIAGAGLGGIFYLRSLDDARRLRAAIGGARAAVVLGAGFIGMEVASVVAKRGLATTLAFPGERVWERLFTPEMSAFFRRYYEERGVRLLSNARVVAFEGDRRVSAVLLDSGRRLPADLVVVGIGAAPAIEASQGSGLALRDGVLVNEYLETNLPGIYAAGDVARYHDGWSGNERRVEHWDNAVAQAGHAARALLGERAPFTHVPYFFSDVFDLSYEFWGDTAEAVRAVHRGEVGDGRFSTWWLDRQNRLVAAFTLNCPEEDRQLAARWVEARRPVAPDLVRNANRPLTRGLAEVA